MSFINLVSRLSLLRTAKYTTWMKSKERLLYPKVSSNIAQLTVETIGPAVIQARQHAKGAESRAQTCGMSPKKEDVKLVPTNALGMAHPTQLTQITHTMPLPLATPRLIRCNLPSFQG